MELGCFISPLCWWVVFFFVVKVARAVSVCFFCSVVTPLRKDQLSEMSPGLYRSANMWHIQAGFPAAWTPSECELQGCLVMYFIFGLIWNLKGYTKSGNRLWSLQGTQYVPFFFFSPPSPFSLVYIFCLSLIYALASPTKQLSVASHSHSTETLKEEVDSTYLFHILRKIPAQKLLRPWSSCSGWAFFLQRKEVGNIRKSHS